MSLAKADKKSWEKIKPVDIELPEEFGNSDEIWIIETPADFDISTLDGKKFNFEDGYVFQQEKVFSKQLLIEDYNNQSWKSESIVVPNEDRTKWRFSHPAGRITVVDQLDQAEYLDQQSAAISPAKCPKWPNGLKKRYKPFGIGCSGVVKKIKKSKKSRKYH